MKPGGGGFSSFIRQTVKCVLTSVCSVLLHCCSSHSLLCSLSLSLFLLLHCVLSLYPFCHELSWSEGLPKQAENDDRQHSSTQTRIL